MVGSDEVEECAGILPPTAEQTTLNESKTAKTIFMLFLIFLPDFSALLVLIVELDLNDKQEQRPQRHPRLDALAWHWLNQVFQEDFPPQSI